ncbi:hypothetical protein MJD09_15670 [bacterium]|nr:hypothetical protein [bacterium]
MAGFTVCRWVLLVIGEWHLCAFGDRQDRVFKHGLPDFFIAASILTLGTVVSAHWSVKFVRLGTVIPAILMITIFVLIQSLNLTVNLTGVKKRLALVQFKELETSNRAHLQILEELGIYYNSLIDKYPLFDERGRARSWKQEHTLTVKAAQDSLTKKKKKMATMKLSRLSQKVTLDRTIVLAWLLLPELYLLAAIVVFSLQPLANERSRVARFIAGESAAEFQVRRPNQKH